MRYKIISSVCMCVCLGWYVSCMCDNIYGRRYYLFQASYFIFCRLHIYNTDKHKQMYPLIILFSRVSQSCCSRMYDTWPQTCLCDSTARSYLAHVARSPPTAVRVYPIGACVPKPSLEVLSIPGEPVSASLCRGRHLSSRDQLPTSEIHLDCSVYPG